MAKTNNKTKCHKCKRYSVLVSLDFNSLKSAKKFADVMSRELPKSYVSVWDDSNREEPSPLYTTRGVEFYL